MGKKGRGKGGALAKAHGIQATSDRLSRETHFNTEECKVLLHIFDKMTFGAMYLDKSRMREILHTTFLITNDVMLDFIFKAFDTDNDGQVTDTEWVKALSTMLRGSIEQLIEYCYFVYDMNGDGSLAREELAFCLKGCLTAGYGVEPDEVEDCERDIIEICLKKLDWDRDGQITFPDFQAAVMDDPLLLQTIGPCLPTPGTSAAFLALICDKFRNYTETYSRHWLRGARGGARNKSLKSVSDTLRSNNVSSSILLPSSSLFESSGGRGSQSSAVVGEKSVSRTKSKS